MKLKILLFVIIGFASFEGAKAQTLKTITPDSILKIIDKLPDSGTVVINFWATWCRPCVHELPYFKKADSILKNDNVTFIFVSFDMPNNKVAVQKFIRKNKMVGDQYLVEVYDMNTFINKVDRSWQGSIPYTIVLTNKERRNHEGAFENYAQLWNFIRE